MTDTAAVVLAAGEGTRMKSSKPKVLQEVLFKPMLDWVTDACEASGIGKICVVAGCLSERVEEHLNGKYPVAIQKERLGTGHAVMQAREFISSCGGDVLVLCGDSPFITPEAIRESLGAHRENGNDVTVITAHAPDPSGYGRIKRDAGGSVCRIVEEKDASEQEKAIDEINSGAFWFRTSVLPGALAKIKNDNAKGEYYLTDTVEILHEAGGKCGTYACGMEVAAAANDRVQLLERNEEARKAVLRRLMLNGVSVVSDAGIIVGPDVKIGRDTLLLPGTIIKGDVTIGSGCVIGPNSMVTDCTFGDNIVFNASQATQSKIGDGATIGPFAHIRPNTTLHAKVHVGDFVELKNSEIGEGTKVPHLSYVGDSDVGAHVNFGCGCVTANYNGEAKYRTKVGSNAFVGCHSIMVAPVEIGDNAYTGAGSVITKNVPENALAVARAKQENLEGWVLRRRKKK